MKILFFPKYTRLGASSRLRTHQYLDYFKKEGIDCTVSPFFSDDYLLELYSSKSHNIFKYIRAFIKRIGILFSVRNYEKVVIEKELFPYFPAIFEWMLWKMGIDYIVDFDDAIFHNYDKSPNWLIRTLLSQKISRVMRYSSVVTCGNRYLEAKAIESGAREVVLIPTVVDVERYTTTNSQLQDPFVIGWIGSPITAKYLPRLVTVFKRLNQTCPIKLRLIGISQTIGFPEGEELLPWSEPTEVDLIKTFSVGIMPLEDNIWERGKCGYKLIQYMACGIPVIGSPIGVNTSIISEGENGFLCNTEEEWETALRFCLENRQNLTEMGSRGRKRVEQEFSLAHYSKVWLRLLRPGKQDFSDLIPDGSKT